MNKYDYNKYPINSFELVCIVQDLADMQDGARYDYLVFPDVLDKYSVATSSEERVKNAIKGAYGQPIIKVISLGYNGGDKNYPITPDSTAGLALNNLRRDSKTFYQSSDPIMTTNLNGKFITAYRTYKIPIPQDIIDSTKEYCDLANKGNASSKGLNATDENRFNELDELLTNYYSQGI